MKRLVAMAIVAVGLYGLTVGGISAGNEPTYVVEHHNTQHSLGPCGTVPCPKPKGVRRMGC